MVFSCCCILHSRVKPLQLQRLEKCLQKCQKKVPTCVGYPCSKWKLLHVKRSRISCPLSQHSQAQTRVETADSETPLRNNLQTCLPIHLKTGIWIKQWCILCQETIQPDPYQLQTKGWNQCAILYQIFVFDESIIVCTGCPQRKIKSQRGSG